jgi:Zn ribbon nucleic-acid-binding protein
MKMVKICQNCKTKFVIKPEDIDFYRKVGVPTPSFCPECRAQRRLAFWNMLILHKRKCDYSGEDIISIYRADSPYKIYKSKVWWSDKWNPMDYGREYDFNRPFFEQFGELMIDVPRPHNFNLSSVNCDYCAGTYNCKNCYMSTGNRSEDCLYSVAGLSKNCVDSFFIIQSENCYENFFCHKNYNVHFSQFSDNCMDSAFLYDCRNCQDCFGCVNLKNKQYHIFNRPYARKEYEKEIKKYNLASYKNLESIKERFDLFKLQFPRKFARVSRVNNVVGDNVSNINNCYYCFDSAKEIENCKYIFNGGWHLRDSYDVFDAGSNSSLLYEGVTCGDNLQRVLFSVNIVNNVYDVEYSNECYSSSSLFGCIGLWHKKYCILNKQYTKKQYEELVPRIRKHMDEMPYVDKKGRVYKYGEFFPIELSPFAYNESLAQEYFPLTEEQAIAQGYKWQDRVKSEYQPSIKAKDLPDNIKDVDDKILKEIIECASSDCVGSGVFRLIPQELKFYRKYGLPLPRFCPDCRHNKRIQQRNPMKLWQRQCQCAGHQSDNKAYQNQSAHPHHKDKHCLNQFMTPYAPDRPEIIYCEECYQREIE